MTDMVTYYRWAAEFVRTRRPDLINEFVAELAKGNVNEFMRTHFHNSAMEEHERRALERDYLILSATERPEWKEGLVYPETIYTAGVLGEMASVKFPPPPPHLHGQGPAIHKGALNTSLQDALAREVGHKADAGKPRTDLLPTDVLMELAQVLRYGADKYADRNWEQGMAWGRPYGAALRHLFAFWDGEDLDDDSGFPHVLLALCEVMFLAAYWLRGTGEDDRLETWAAC